MLRSFGGHWCDCIFNPLKWCWFLQECDRVYSGALRILKILTTIQVIRSSIINPFRMKNRTISHLIGTACTAFLMLTSVCVFAQVPAGMNYQAVARDNDGDILANRSISMRFSITNGQAGSALYQERHVVLSNQFGLVTLAIGTGTPLSGTFDDISWNSIAPWLKVEMDPNGGTSYINMGTSRLLSVPYAFYAESVKGGIPSGSAPGNTLYWNGFTWIANSSNIFNNGGNVGINTTTPSGKLHVKGSENVPQLIVDASSDQTNANPLIKLRRSNGLDVLWIHSNDPSNVFIGVEAGLNNAGTDNTGIGAGALRDNTSGSLNTAIGLHALFFNTTGSDNTAIGSDALLNNMQGDSNLAIGNFALNDNTQGIRNTAIGVNSLSSNTTGNQNTANGASALHSNITGNGNIAIGFNALSDNTTGSFRTALGTGSNSAGANFSNNTAIGYNAICSGSNQVRIGNSEVTSIGGFADWTNVSDARFKSNVAENVMGLDFINALRPVTYTMDLHAIDDWFAENYDLPNASRVASGSEPELTVYTGFIAQEVEATAKSLGFDFSGIDAPKNDKDYYGLRYSTFVVPLVKAVQEQQKQIESLQKENAQLRMGNDQRLTEQQQQINALQSALEEIKAGLEKG